MTNTAADYALMAMDSYSRGDRADIPNLPFRLWHSEMAGTATGDAARFALLLVRNE